MTHLKGKKLLTYKKKYKRLVKLLYKKGYISKYFGDKWVDNTFYWETYKGCPQLYSCTLDYWGEAEEYEITRVIFEGEIYGSIDAYNIDMDNFNMYDFLKKERPIFSRSYAQITKYLNKLPNKINNHKINFYLKMDFKY